MPKTAAGQRTIYVEIQKRTVTRGTSKTPVENWSTLRKVFANREDLLMNDSGERLNGAQLSARMESAWGLPYMADMDPDLVNVASERRLVLGTRIYDITRATVQGPHKQEIQLITRAKAA